MGEVLIPDDLAALPTQKVREPPTGREPAVGTRIDRFEVRGVLGRGGMGLVLAAYDPRLQRNVAIKLVRASEGGSSSDERARLLREARAMAQLRHPNIVSVFDAGEVDGQVYIAMEHVEGGSLTNRLRELHDQGRADWRRILELFAQAGRGLAAAHDAGMVHRDFKPDNVFVDNTGRVLVGDFGLVGHTQSAEPMASDSDVFSERLTRADEVLGTPVYMAPEQHTGEPIDARADQFSFCVALYEALFGRLPFRGNSREAYFNSIRRSDVRPVPPGRGAPGWLLDVLMRGLSVDPDKRFASMQDVLAELGQDPSSVRRLGAVERGVFVGGIIAFLLAWSGAVIGFRVTFTYQLHWVTDCGFLALALALCWVARDAIARSELNRRAGGFVLVVAASMLVLVGGSQIGGLLAETCATLHMLVVGACALVGILLFGWRALPMSLTYLAGYLVSATWPSLLLPCLGTAHSVAAVTAVVIFRVRGPTANSKNNEY